MNSLIIKHLNIFLKAFAYDKKHTPKARSGVPLENIYAKNGCFFLYFERHFLKALPVYAF